MIWIYHFLQLMLLPVYLILGLIRLFTGKESLKSIPQRLGFSSCPRPSGKLIWIHAASVGESIAAITLIDHISLKYPDYKFLITTTTLSSSKILLKNLSDKIIHQFMPIDNLLAVNLFLHHWRPDLGIFIESELWPCIAQLSAKKMKLLLINARLSDKSYQNWGKIKTVFQEIISNFSLVITQSAVDLQKFQDLGCVNLINLGNIKFSNKKLSVNIEELEKLQLTLGKKQVAAEDRPFSKPASGSKMLGDLGAKGPEIVFNIHEDPSTKSTQQVAAEGAFGGKYIFVAASTHKEDEEILLPIIAHHKQQKLNYYPIIILRHPDRRKELMNLCDKHNLTYSLRSDCKQPDINKDLYIVDTFMEMGLFYSLAYAVFIGGSFKQGGHNLAEAAFFNNIILFGPDMTNFHNIADQMIQEEAAIQVRDGDDLDKKLQHIFSGEYKDNHAQNALNYVMQRQKIITKYLDKIESFL